nr:hypothetical protein [Tanacetum cinerariifolium]
MSELVHFLHLITNRFSLLKEGHKPGIPSSIANSAKNKKRWKEVVNSIKCLMPYALGMPGNIGSTMSRWWIETNGVTGLAANRPMHVILHI